MFKRKKRGIVEGLQGTGCHTKHTAGSTAATSLFRLLEDTYLNQKLAVFLQSTGAFAVAFGALPLLIYRIFNTGTACLLLGGLLLLAAPRLWRTVLLPYPRLRVVLALAGGLGALFLLVLSLAIARRAWFRPPPENTDFPAIVLGSKINGDRPSLMLERRLRNAARYLRQTPTAHCVVSGGQGADEAYPEALVMRDFLVELGIESERILMEDQSASTEENLRFSLQTLQEAGVAADTVVIVTDSFHQMRASFFASTEGSASYNISSLTPWGLMPAYWVREISAISWAWISHRLA